VKKIARALGVIGGLAALIWAMRDRLISIAAPKEPEPPKFRVVPPIGLDERGDDLTEITGIGPVFASRLRAEGITTFKELSDAGPQVVSDAAGVPLTRASDWVDQAAARASV